MSDLTSWWAAWVEERQCSQIAFPPIAARYTARNTTCPTPGTATTAWASSTQGSDNTLGTVQTWVWWPSRTKVLTFAGPGLKERPCPPTWVTILPLFLYRDWQSYLFCSYSEECLLDDCLFISFSCWATKGDTVILITFHIRLHIVLEKINRQAACSVTFALEVSVVKCLKLFQN